jgi:hypothetical protein
MLANFGIGALACITGNRALPSSFFDGHPVTLTLEST